MDAPLIRPIFTVPLRLPRPVAVERLRTGFAGRDELQGRWRGRGTWAELYVTESERRVWSPFLSIRVDEEGDQSIAFGRFGPHPEVWTFFMFLYFGAAFLVALGGTLGYVQWLSGLNAWGLWAASLGVGFLALLHLASAMGRRWGQDQMRELKSIVDGILAEMEVESGGGAAASPG